MDVLSDEIESLEAILMDDVKIIRNANTDIPELIETTILPTVGEAIDQQYVCITLQVIPTDRYPDTRPIFHLKNPRGLDDQMIARIKIAVEMKLDDSVGQPVVFDLIDLIREHLTNSNLPSGQCVVCLYGFQDGDEFTKTICYHYLHSYCLVRHLLASKKNYQEEQDKLPAWQRQLSKQFQAFCPVCRDPISYDVEPLRKAKPPTELKNAPKFELTHELKELQARMSNLFMQQKKRGGIIDLDAAENNVISIESEEPAESDLKNDEPFETTVVRNNQSTPLDQQSSVSVPNNNQSNRSVYNHRSSAGRNVNYHQQHQHQQPQPNQYENRYNSNGGGGGGGGRRNGSGGGGGGRYKRGGYHNHHNNHQQQQQQQQQQQHSSSAPFQHPGCSNPR